MKIGHQIDSVISKTRVKEAALGFLQDCKWELEIGDEIVQIPQDVELYVRSRAFVKADAPDMFLGNHFEATVLIGYEQDEDMVYAKYGMLRMYFNEAGEFVSEDRFSRYA